MRINLASFVRANKAPLRLIIVSFSSPSFWQKDFHTQHSEQGAASHY